MVLRQTEATIHKVNVIILVKFLPPFFVQLVWGGSYQTNAALSTGESMEQFFSYFGKCGLTTKNMGASGIASFTLELLADLVCLYYNVNHSFCQHIQLICTIFVPVYYLIDCI